jgi:hypothetical protein
LATSRAVCTTSFAGIWYSANALKSAVFSIFSSAAISALAFAASLFMACATARA